MPTLREIDADLRALETLLMEVGGDVTEEEAEEAVRQWFDEIGRDLKVKLDGYATFITETKLRAATRRAEASRLADLAKVDENAVKRLRDTLLWFMQKHGHQEIQANLHRFRVANNGGKTPLYVSQAVRPVDAVGSPMDRFVKVSYEWDTNAIRDALDQGEDLGSFARYEERGQHVRIK